MILSNEQSTALLEAAKPLIEWMNENCHPHYEAHVDQNTVELMEVIDTKRTDEFLKN